MNTQNVSYTTDAVKQRIGRSLRNPEKGLLWCPARTHVRTANLKRHRSCLTQFLGIHCWLFIVCGLDFSFEKALLYYPMNNAIIERNND